VTVRRVARRQGRRQRVAPALLTRLGILIHQHPTLGYRRHGPCCAFVRRSGSRPASTAGDPRPPGAGASESGGPERRVVGDLTHIHCGADGWAHLAAIIDCHDREIVGYEFARRGRAKKAERALEESCPGALRHAAPYRHDAPYPLRQWARVSEPTVLGGLSRLSAAAGIHHPVHARAERHHRAFLPESQRRVCLAAHVPELRGGAPRDRWVDPLVQRGAPASGPGLSEHTRTSLATRYWVA
jgi:hypothetical protein